jgi:hypothetical protein
MTEQEMIEILEGIAREGPPTARVSAIRLLLELTPSAEDAGNFEALDELGVRRKGREALLTLCIS